jgi:hypothetical protein
MVHVGLAMPPRSWAGPEHRAVCKAENASTEKGVEPPNLLAYYPQSVEPARLKILARRHQKALMSRADNNPLAASVIAVALALAGGVAMAADAPEKKNPRPAKPAAAPREVKLPEATPDQEKAAELVHYGVYECEFNQSVNILASTTHHFYVNVKHGKTTWLMKPVLSTTGACPECVKGETLMVQTPASRCPQRPTKHRLVDACISPPTQL